MLDKLSRKPTEKPCNTIDTLIGVSTEMKGDITFSGGLRIDGKVKGNITGQIGRQQHPGAERKCRGHG